MVSTEAHEQPTEWNPETLHIDLVTTAAVQEQLSKLALLLGTPPYLQSIKKVQEGVFKFGLTQELVDLRTGILDIDHQDMVAKTSAIFKFRDLKPNEAANLRTAVLLVCKATLYTDNDNTFYIQRLPIDSEVYQAINSRVREIDPEIETYSHTHHTHDTKMLLQSRTAPSSKAETTLHSGSVCVVLQNVCIEIVKPLVPFLLIPRLTSKV
ncbi:hypothetical protein CC86DRAFT_375948 [Ophiobolus disseminans]|uniref:Uncharacterized protein n=1 Tax=Ophiobolus disseminans TaxID=1469910 RepID=A0A6A6ZD27_9PLEO|nr:hypothetical protein CC86DRAFT_375948 [Ophiobolus disseminans]